MLRADFAQIQNEVLSRNNFSLSLTANKSSYDNTTFIKDDKGKFILVPLFPESAPGVEKLLKKYGSYEALLPANEFESDMLHGKLSALRWVLGWEWDFLDT